jgi:hypothetical protein
MLACSIVAVDLRQGVIGQELDQALLGLRQRTVAVHTLLDLSGSTFPRRPSCGSPAASPARRAHARCRLAFRPPRLCSFPRLRRPNSEPARMPSRPASVHFCSSHVERQPGWASPKSVSILAPPGSSQRGWRPLSRSFRAFTATCRFSGPCPLHRKLRASPRLGRTLIPPPECTPLPGGRARSRVGKDC